MSTTDIDLEGLDDLNFDDLQDLKDLNELESEQTVSEISENTNELNIDDFDVFDSFNDSSSNSIDHQSRRGLFLSSKDHEKEEMNKKIAKNSMKVSSSYCKDNDFIDELNQFHQENFENIDIQDIPFPQSFSNDLILDYFSIKTNN